jgi:hypothetical protein
MSMEPVLLSFSYALGYLREQVEDLPIEDMVRQPKGVPNHPAWTIGHLVLICQSIGEVAGLKPWLDQSWETSFGPRNTPKDKIAAYPGKDELLAALADAESRLVAAVRGLDDSALEVSFPDPAYLEVFPTVRHALTQVLVGHTSFHVGQIAVWRRAMGLTGLSRSFE